MTKLEKRTVAVAGFPYTRKMADGSVVHAFATRNQEVELFDETEIERGDRLGYFLKPGQTPPSEGGPLTLNELGLMTDEQLLDLLNGDGRPSAKELLDAVGNDPSLAQRVLQAENASDHSPRKTVVDGLERIAGGL